MSTTDQTTAGGDTSDDLPFEEYDEQHSAAPDAASNLVKRWSAAVVAASTAKPKRVLAIVGVLTVVFLAAFVRVEIDTDPENMLPADSPARVINAELRETFGGAETIVVGLFSPTDMIDADALAAVATLHDELAAAEGVDERLLVSPRTALPPGDVH